MSKLKFVFNHINPLWDFSLNEKAEMSLKGEQ
jgi:hypothetical protein